MVVDIIVVLIIVVLVLNGYRRGLLGAMLLLLAVAVSCLGAVAAEQTFAPRCAERITPYIALRVENNLEEQLKQELDNAANGEIRIGEETLSLSKLLDTLEILGIDAQIESGTDQSAESLAERIAYSVAEAIAAPLSQILVFTAAFIIIYSVLKSLALGANITDRVPVVRTLNHGAGAVVGFLVAVVTLTTFMFVLVEAGIAEDGMFEGPVCKGIRRIAILLLSRLKSS